MRIVNPTPGIWSFEVVASGEIHNGNFHMWLPITEFLNTEVLFPDPLALYYSDGTGAGILCYQRFHL